MVVVMLCPEQINIQTYHRRVSQQYKLPEDLVHRRMGFLDRQGQNKILALPDLVLQHCAVS